MHDPNVERARYTPEFLAFWNRYPKKLGASKIDAFGAWVRARADTPAETVMEGLERFPFNANPQFQPHPASWLNRRLWEIEEDTPPPKTRQPLGKGAWMEGYGINGHFVDLEHGK